MTEVAEPTGIGDARLLRVYFPQIPFYIGGTSLLIVVSVTMDTVTQIQSHLIAHQYEGMIKKSKLGGKKK